MINLFWHLEFNLLLKSVEKNFNLEGYPSELIEFINKKTVSELQKMSILYSNDILEFILKPASQE